MKTKQCIKMNLIPKPEKKSIEFYCIDVDYCFRFVLSQFSHLLVISFVFCYCFILFSCFDFRDVTKFAHKINEKKFMPKTDVLLSFLLCPYRFELIVYVHTPHTHTNKQTERKS